ncbi:MAG: EI24 domain-containing protein [Pseudolysinimonas sp.]
MPQRVARSPGATREFLSGFAVLGRGFALWRRRPGLMLLGMVPAVVVAIVFAAVVVLLAINIQAVISFITPFADNWDAELARLFRLLAAVALIIGVVALGAFGYTTITLLVGDPVYARIWREIEREHGELPEGLEPGFWRGLADSGWLFWRAVGLGLVLTLVGIIPLVGAPLAVLGELVFGGRIVALELTSRPLEARGLLRVERRRVLRSRNARVVGFGVAVNLCMLLPGGAVLVMPAAVAGATELARHALDTHAAVAQAGAPAGSPS